MRATYFFSGFSKEQIKRGRALLAEAGAPVEEMRFVPVDDEILQAKVEELLLWFDNHEQPEIIDAVAGLKAVIMAVDSREQGLHAMRIYKSILEDPSEPAFAMVTQTSLVWPLADYLEHIHKEHEYMKTHNPADDPDMKRIDS